MTRRNERGFSLVELLVAIVVLATGVLAMAAGSLIVTRDLHRSRMTTLAGGRALGKMDELASYAAAVTGCGSLNFISSSSAQTAYGVTMSWVVPTSGALRTVRVITSYSLAAGRSKTDTLTASVAC